MTSPPPSIASLIAGQGVSGLGAGADEDQAALLTYLKAQYSEATSHNDLGALPTNTYRQTPTPTPIDHDNTVPMHDYDQYARSSPPNPSIPIPQSLVELAAQSSTVIELPSLPNDFQHDEALFGKDDRGEMGGRRRKLPHERAGWKEMDQDNKTKRKRGGRRAGSGSMEASGQIGTGNGEMDSMNYLTAHDTHQKMDVNGQMGMEGSNGTSFGAATDVKSSMPSGGNQETSDPSDPNLEPNSKKARAEQNRRAQQVFRRKREEHMKKLENDSASLETTRHSLALAESKLKEIALQAEADHIEKLALRLALRNLSQMGNSILDNDSALITQIGVQPRKGVEDNTADVEQAFRTLEAQSRELAKANRNKRSLASQSQQ